MSEPIRIFIDGACSPNPGHMGSGVVIEWQGRQPEIISKYTGEGTNNISEYNSLLIALQLIREYSIRNVKILTDSNLVYQQTKPVKPWKCNDAELIKLRDKAVSRINWLKEDGYLLQIEYIPREMNVADEPAKKGSKMKDGL